MADLILGCDLAKHGGFAWFERGELVGAAFLRPALKRDGHHLDWSLDMEPMVGRGGCLLGFPTDMAAYVAVTRWWLVSGDAPPPERVVIERGHGPHAKSVDKGAWRRGYLTCAAHNAGIADVVEVNNATWARIVGKHFADPFPKTSEARKKHSVKLATRMGVSVPLARHDVADACCVGLAGSKI